MYNKAKLAVPRYIMCLCSTAPPSLEFDGSTATLQRIALGVVQPPLGVLIVVDQEAGVHHEEASLEPTAALPLLVQEAYLNWLRDVEAKLAGGPTFARHYENASTAVVT